MNIIDRLKRKYVFLIHKYFQINQFVINKDYLKILQDEIYIINDNIPLGTSSWENNRKEIRKAIIKGDLSDFINWDVIQRTMFFEAPRIEYETVMCNSLLSTAINESKVGNPKRYYLNMSTSGNLIHHAYSISHLLNNCDILDFNKVIELGGGYGSMCRLFRNMNYFGKYIIYDLPEFSALQKFYLSSVDTKYTDNTIFSSDMNKLNDDNISALFIATWSFSEMPIELREQLLNYMIFDYCIIAFQEEFDDIDNIDYFNKFMKKYKHINFNIIPIEHLRNHYYLVGTKK